MTVRMIGDVTVGRVEENAGPSFKPHALFPSWTEAALEKHRSWLVPRCYDERSGRFVMSLHSWIIRTGRHTILVDTCVGNDKERSRPTWNRLSTPWLDRLRDAGVHPEEVDFVLCTHLHTDHVGWNTRLENGRWVPTFPNAKYLFSKTDYEYWGEKNRSGPALDNAYNDSVLPVVEAGRAVLVADGDGHTIDERFEIAPAPGHTPGHVTLKLVSKGESALFTGDIMHHPIQVHEPDWNSRFCEWPDEAAKTRRRVLESIADTATLMLPAHFAAPHCGYVRSDGDSFRFAFAD